MRRSGRSKTKSLKAELEDNAQSKYKLLKLQSSRSENGDALIGIQSEVGGESTSEEEENESQEGHEGEGKGSSLEEKDAPDDSKEIKIRHCGKRKRSVGKTPDSQLGKRVRCVKGKISECEGTLSESEEESDKRETETESEDEEREEEGVVGVRSSKGQWSHYPALCAALPGRERQIELLLTLLGEPGSATCPALHVYGHTDTGKTLTLQTVLSTLKAPHAFVNCIECCSSRLLFETILNQLSGTSPSLCSGGGSNARCDNMAVFIRLLQKVAADRGLTNTTLYIVLDKAERLREMEATLLPALLRLSELSQCMVCTVLVSELVWEKFHMDTGGLSPYPLHFPQYTKAEVLIIMCRDCPSTEPLPFYTTFANHIWNVFQCVCRDLGELRYLSSLLYPKYCEPVETGEIGRQETRKLWRHIEPYFRGVMSKIYLREISSVQWEKAQAREQASDAVSATSLAAGLSQSKNVLELPYFSKYLLIASYLASYNPSKTDKKFFSKQKQVRSRKSKKFLRKKEKPNHQLLGPKAFPLDRLMAIFYSILEESVTPSADIYSQISSLVTLQLISQLHTKDPLDGPKYKCLVTLEPVQQIARSIGFDLVLYLYDFN